MRLAPEDAPQPASATSTVSPPGCQGWVSDSLHHKASSYAECPPSGTGLHSYLSAHVQESHGNYTDYIFQKKLALGRSLHYHCCLAKGGKPKEALCCFYFCLLDCRTPQSSVPCWSLTITALNIGNVHSAGAKFSFAALEGEVPHYWRQDSKTTAGREMVMQ